MTGTYYLSFNKTKIYYRLVRGTRDKTIIFLHGLGGNQAVWEPNIKFFNKLGYSTLTLDLRGHGYSERSNSKDFYSIENQADDIIDLLNNLKLYRPVVVGHCLGGMVSATFAAKYKKRLSGLILISAVERIQIPGRKLATSMLKALKYISPPFRIKDYADYKKYVGTGDWNIKRIASDISHTSLKSYLAVLDEAASFEGNQILTGIKVPTLIVAGKEDSIFSEDQVAEVHKKIKSSQYKVIQGVNHISTLNAPDVISQNIHDFLKQLNF